MSSPRCLRAMIECILVVLFSLLPRTADAAAPDPKHRWTPTDADNPHWKMSIANLSAVGDLPYADFSLTLLPGKFLPRATCRARVLNIPAIAGTPTPSTSTSDGKPKPKPNPKVWPLPSTDWINCTLPDIHATNNLTNATTPIAAQSNHTRVMFRWVQLETGGGGAVLNVQSNMSFASGGLFEQALDSLVGVWPPRSGSHSQGRVEREVDTDGFGVLREMARAVTGTLGGGGGSSVFDDPGALFVWQQGTFNIPAGDLGVGANNYMGQTNLSTLVDWVGICDGAGQCR